MNDETLVKTDDEELDEKTRDDEREDLDEEEELDEFGIPYL